jgi:methylated-DNA-[protein]-cysteine S-methyltransferase
MLGPEARRFVGLANATLFATPSRVHAIRSIFAKLRPPMTSQPLVFRSIDAPAPMNSLTLVASEEALVAILWSEEEPRASLGELRPETAPNSVLAETERQLREYFAGERQSFELPLDFRGTPFQKKVWAALLEIPYGETRSYAQIAAKIEQPTATRAVGGANGRNPIPIVAACHRVIGASGALTGFGGGLETKVALLSLEKGESATSGVQRSQ